MCHFSSHILAMTSSSDALLDHIADYLQFISNSNAQLFWLTLNTSMTMAATSPVDSVRTRKTTRLCHLLSRRPGVVLSCQLVVASPLAVLSLCRPLVVLSRQLVVGLPLAVLSFVLAFDTGLGGKGGRGQYTEGAKKVLARFYVGTTVKAGA